MATGEVTTESYDKLVLSPGAAPIRPPLPGIDLPGIFSVRTVPDARTIRAVAGSGLGDPDRARLVHGTAGRDEAEARGGGRRRVHRSRDGGELRPPRARGDARREARPGHAAARPGDGAARRALHGQARREARAERRRRRVPAGRGRLARGAHELRQGPPGGRRGPRDRRAAGDGARQGGRARARPARRHPRRRADAHERPRHPRRRRRGRGEGLRHRPVDAHPARRARPTGRAGSPPR